MKRKHITAILLAFSAASILGGCQGKQAGEAASEPETTAAVQETTAAEVEEESFSGVILAIDGNILTIQNYDDDSEKKYSIENAEVTADFPLSAGDEIYVDYLNDPAAEVLSITSLDVDESFLAQTQNAYVEGTVADFTPDTVVLEVADGEQFTFISGNAYTVSASGIEAGDTVTVTYTGDMDSDPLAVKIVESDSYDTPEAARNAIHGIILEADEYLILETADDESVTFYSDSLDFTEFSEGDTVLVYYTGKIDEGEAEAESLEEYNE